MRLQCNFCNNLLPTLYTKEMNILDSFYKWKIPALVSVYVNNYLYVMHSVQTNQICNKFHKCLHVVCTCLDDLKGLRANFFAPPKIPLVPLAISLNNIFDVKMSNSAPFCDPFLQ